MSDMDTTMRAQAIIDIGKRIAQLKTDLGRAAAMNDTDSHRGIRMELGRLLCESARLHSSAYGTFPDEVNL